MKSVIKQPTRNDTAADNKHAQPATPVRCKHCNRRFATISAEGGLNPSTSHEQACASCEPFLGLHDTLRAREQEHTALLDRGPKHHGRILAHEQFRKARVALENFLVSIEASFDVAQAGYANRTESVSLERANEPKESPKHGDDQSSLNGTSPSVGHVSPTTASPTMKRKLARNSGALSLERKRIKFCEDVEERPEYRGTLEYYRSAKEYVPGRYAVTEGSEYEDTSGSTISFAKFTGQKKVGSTFVDIISKEGAREGGTQTSAVKKRGKGNDKKSLGLTDKPDTLEKDESQMDSRELRLSRRARSTTPPATTSPRRISAPYDGQEDELSEGPNDTPSFVVTLKIPQLTKYAPLTNGDKPDLESRHIGGGQRSSSGSNINKTALEAPEPAIINQIITNIHRELRILQQTTVSPKYVDMVTKAVRGCIEALEPLEHLDRTQPHQIGEPAEPQEDGSIYFEALDGTGESISTNRPRSDDTSNPIEVVPKWSDATVKHENSHETNVSLALNANTLDDVLKEDKQSLSGISESERTNKDGSVNMDISAPSIKNVGWMAKQTKTKRAKKLRPHSEHRDSQAAKPVTTQSRTSERVSIESRRRSGRTNSTAPPDDRSPDDEVAARPSTTGPRKPRAAPSRNSPALLLSAVSDPKESEQHGRNADSSGHNADYPPNLELDGNKNATEGPHVEDEDVPSSCHEPPNSYRKAGFRTAGIDASPQSSHTAYQNPVDPLEPTLDASLIQPPRNEAAEGMHQSFGELINGRDEKQGTHNQCASQAHSETPYSINNHNLGVAPVGEAGEESEELIMDTDRHGAGREAQVDPDTAHDSAQVEIIDNRDLSADRKDENIIRPPEAEMHDAVQQSSRSPRNTFGDRDEANAKMAVEIPRDHRTAASQVGGQNGSLHLIGTERSELNRADRSI